VTSTAYETASPSCSTRRSATRAAFSFTNLGPDDPEVHRSASLLDCNLEEVAPIEILEATLMEPQWPE
jgi:hypothetical protein